MNFTKLSLACLCFIFVHHLQAATCTWLGGNWDWNDPAKWSCGIVPGANDDVIISTTGTITANSPITVKTLTITNGGAALVVTGDINITGLLTWEAGQIKGSGNTFANGGVLFQGSQTKTLADRSLTLNANSTWSNGMIVVPQNLALTVPSGVIFEITGDDILRPQLGNTGVLVNNGTIQKSGGARTTLETVNFTNHGLVEVTTGTLEFRGCNSDGDFTITAPGILQLYQNTLNLQDTASISGTGTFMMGSASPVVIIIDSSEISCPVDIVAGTLNIGHSLTLPILKTGTSSAISITGSEGLVVLDTFFWNGGDIENLLDGARFEGPVIMAGSMKTVENCLVELFDSTFWQAGQIRMRTGGRIKNLGVFTAEMISANNIQQQSNAPGTEFRNDGALHIRDYDASQAVLVNVPFVNNGPIYVESGEFQVEEGTSNAPVFISANALLEKTGAPNSAFVFQSGNINGPGALKVSSGDASVDGANLNADLNISGGKAIIWDFPDSIASVTMAGGTLEANVNVYVEGPFNTTGNNNILTGTAAITTLGGATFAAGGTLNITGVTLDLESDTDWMNGNIQYGPGGVINNKAGMVFSINLPANRTIGGTGTGHQFNNAGTVKLLSSNRVVFQNSVAVSNTGVFQGVGIYDFKATMQNSGTFAPGLSPGELTLAGNIQNNSLLDFELTETNDTTSFDQLAIRGNLTLGGTLQLKTNGHPAPGEYVLIYCDSLPNCLSGNFTATDLPAGMTLFVTNDTVSVEFEPCSVMNCYWTGAGNSMNWTESANWDSGFVPYSCHHVVISSGHAVVVQAGETVVGKTLEVQAGASLDVEQAGVLDVKE